MTELTKEQAILIGNDLKALREKYKQLFPSLTLAGWIEQLGSCGYRYLQAEDGKINIHQPMDYADPKATEDWKSVFAGSELRKPTTLRAKIINCLYVGCVVQSFQLACTAADTILKHVAETENSSRY